MTTGQLILHQLDQINRQMAEERKASSESRSKVYTRLEQMHVQIVEVVHRVEAVERTVASHSPTIAEYLQVKQQVIGGGKAGKLAWAVGIILLNVIAWLAGLPSALAAWVKSL